MGHRWFDLVRDSLSILGNIAELFALYLLIKSVGSRRSKSTIE